MHLTTLEAIWVKKDKYEVGETLICRKYKKVGNIKFNVNYRFKSR